MIYTDPSPVDYWRTICKPSDESRNTTTTLTADTDLQFAVAANEVWVFQMILHYRTGATEDFKFGHNGPTSPTRYRLWRRHTVPAGTSFVVADETAYNTAGVAMTSTSTDAGWIEFNGYLENGSNAGTWSVDWCQNSSGATNTIVEKGSFLRLAKVG